MSLFHSVVTKAADYFFRKRSPALIVFRGGISLLTMTLLGNFAFNARYENAHQVFRINIPSSDVPISLLTFGFYCGVALVVIGLIWEIHRDVAERRKLARQVVISLEERGLVNTSDSPLSTFIQLQYKGKRVDPIVIDIRDSLANGAVNYPVPALQKFLAIENSIEERRNQVGADDVEIIYGGLVPVPFAFLTGYLIDDESKVEVTDWDCQISNWRHLDGNDDGESFLIERSYQNRQSRESVVAISFSYPVDTTGIRKSFPNLPQIHLKLDNLRFDNHWSKRKQDRLAYEFVETLKSLIADGVEQIHLVLACQNSVAFRFGQAYDRRNLPPITVYQYERSKVNRYPWGVYIPQSQQELIQVVDNKHYIIDAG